MITLGTSTLNSDWVHIYSEDPALDRNVESFSEIFERWQETGDDDELKKILLPGQKPTRWKLRHPKGRVCEVLKDKLSIRDNGLPSNTSLWDACRMCLAGCDDVGNEDSIRFVTDSETKARVISDESMSLLQEIDGGRLVYELGIVILLKLAPLDKKKLKA